MASSDPAEWGFGGSGSHPAANMPPPARRRAEYADRSFRSSRVRLTFGVLLPSEHRLAPSDLRDQLQATLSGRYTLERELGGGGMSRVFVAEETALGRKVADPVYAPIRSDPRIQAIIERLKVH